MNAKNRFLFTIIILICFGGYYLFSYVKAYNISNNNESIQASLTGWMNRGVNNEVSDEENLNLLKFVQIDSSTSYIALYHLDNKYVGYAHFIKGINGKFKLDESGHKTGEVNYRDIKTNKGVYGVLVGRNVEKNIDNITTKLINEEYSYTTSVSNEAFFVKYNKIPSQFKKTFPAEITLFDENNEIISKAN
ncbi:hypothetical protein [Cohnella abietis]|uniref:Uncharacterized protein n=1 Tax=Cohnella abietis TaxID=2507935 RepID=A0A3T1D543_9BACL|nr:hypothetical protein [Cohnella abietis]BBI33095.1 hypothetical protein KCTCHS21_24940 [Cohnella abietis]